jgi:hypothetical protein
MDNAAGASGCGVGEVILVGLILNRAGDVW